MRQGLFDIQHRPAWDTVSDQRIGEEVSVLVREEEFETGLERIPISRAIAVASISSVSGELRSPKLFT
jgi:hypothetical protein